jgi:transposase
MMRVGLYRPVHVKTLRSQKLRVLLTHRKLLQSKAIAIENDLRATLRNFGLKVGMVGTVKFEARIKELVENLPVALPARKGVRPTGVELTHSAGRSDRILPSNRLTPTTAGAAYSTLPCAKMACYSSRCTLD